MISKTFLITSELGIHARPATKLVNLAMSLESEIDLTSNERTINLKSIMGLMSLGIYKGQIIKVEVTGDSKEIDLKKIEDFLLNEGIGIVHE